MVITYVDITERKQAEEYTGHLASFPQLNPSPVIEVDSSGSVLFFNPATRTLLESLGFEKGDVTPFLPADLGNILSDWDRRSESVASREIAIADRVFAETIFLAPQFDTARIYARDITERRRFEEELEAAALFLRLVNESKTKTEMIGSAVAFFQRQSGCEAVGIRLREEEDYPYYEVRGFPVEFVQAENSLCTRDDAGKAIVDSRGYPVMECMCGNVIQGRFDPSKPFFSPKGSFWTNNTTELLATSNEADRQSRTRNRCNGEGYESVALIALHVGSERLGLIQLNDRRKGRFSAGLIALWERLAGYLAIGVARFQAEEGLKKAHDELEKRVEERTEDIRRQADLLDLAYDAVIVRDMGGKIVYWNSGADDTYGWTREDAVGNVIQSLLRTEFPLPLEEIVKTASREGRWEGELRQTRKDGRQIVVLSRWALRKDRTGAPEAIMEVNRDITERKHAEDLLRMAGAYNRSLIEASPDPLVTIDRQGKISDVNTATEHVTGYTRETLIGTDFFDYFTDPEKAREGYKQAFEEGLVRDYELEIRHRDGDVTPVLYNASVYRDATGDVGGVFAAARDMTEQRRLEDHLRQVHKMEAIGTLAGGIAHDFNNILAAILGYTEMALEDVQDRPQVENSLQRVLKSAMRARDLVKQILTFSRKTEQTRNPISLSPVIRDTVQLLRASIPATIEILFKDTAVSDTVFASAVEVEQILMNLSTNAAFAMQISGGTLSVSLSDVDFGPDTSSGETDGSPAEYVQLTVTDTGTGMAPEVMKRVFEPFFTTKGVGQGTGMGLAIVYGIVKDLNGTITVESQIGVGTTFRVLLPKTVDPVKREVEGTARAAGGSERILFIDDEEMLVEWGRAVLERLGYEVTASMGSAEALSVFSADVTRFDLVITDQTMPGMTGVDLAGEILRLRPDMPIILCTGHSEIVSPEEAHAAGIREFLMKPVARQEMARAIRRALGK